MRFRYLILFLFFSITLHAQDSLIFIIRVDDIMGRNMTYLPRSIQPFEEMVNQRHAKITWAVIPHRLIEPANQNGSLRQELITSVQHGHEVSQHGYNHYCPVDNSWNHEMVCSGQQVSFTAAYQESLIVAGKQILRDSLGIQPVSFVPPGHSADSTTYRLLVDSGFRWISTTEPTKTYIRNGLYNLKPHGEFTWALQASQYQLKLQEALSGIRTQGEADGYYCLLLHDYFIRAGYENGLVIQWTGELLDSLTAYYGNRIRFMTLNEAANYFSRTPLPLEPPPAVVAESVQLFPNYPNPFNPSTVISWHLITGSPVRLSVYTVAGQKVVTLLNEWQSAGFHSAEFDAMGLASGVYLYRLEAQNFTQSRKMVLSR